MSEEEKQEFIHEAEDVVEPIEEQTKPISVMDMLQIELRRCMESALELKKKIDSAKTDYKKTYYSKKLKKNNTEALQVLTAIEKYKQQKSTVYENKPEEKNEPDKE